MCSTIGASDTGTSSDQPVRSNASATLGSPNAWFLLAVAGGARSGLDAGVLQRTGQAVELGGGLEGVEVAVEELTQGGLGVPGFLDGGRGIARGRGGIGAGVLTPDGTINGFIDRLLLPGRFYDRGFDPEGILCILSATSVTLMGSPFSSRRRVWVTARAAYFAAV